MSYCTLYTTYTCRITLCLHHVRSRETMVIVNVTGAQKNGCLLEPLGCIIVGLHVSYCTLYTTYTCRITLCLHHVRSRETMVIVNVTGAQKNGCLIEPLQLPQLCKRFEDYSEVYERSPAVPNGPPAASSPDQPTCRQGSAVISRYTRGYERQSNTPAPLQRAYALMAD